jgi:hypothetical protein
MVLASKGRIRPLVTETINPQIASATSTAMTTRPIHAPASSVGDSDDDVLEISSISGVMQIVPQLHNFGKGSKHNFGEAVK